MSWIIAPRGAWPDFHHDWDRLNQEHHDAHPLLDARFVGPLLDTFGTERTHLALERIDGVPARMLLLDSLGYGAWETFSPAQQPVAPAVAAVRAGSGSALGSLFHSLPGVSCLVGLQRWDDAYQGAWNAMDPLLEILPYATTMSVDLNDAFESYWHARPNKLRNNIGRYFRRLEKAQLGYHLTEARDPAQIDAATIAYGELESSGWKGAEGSAIHERNEQGRFYRAVMQNFASVGRARVFELRFDTELVASRLMIENDSMLIFLKTTYAEQRAEFAPGRLLLYLVLQRLFAERRLRHVEFYTNATVDQLQWSTASRALCHLNCYRWFVLRKARAVVRGLQRRERARSAPVSSANEDHASPAQD